MRVPFFSSLSVSSLLQVLLDDESTNGTVLDRAAQIGCSSETLFGLAEWHFNTYKNYVEFGFEATLEQQSSETIALFLSWLIAPLRNSVSFLELESNTNGLIKRQWQEDFGSISAEVVKKQEIVLLGWALGKPLWANRKNYPASFLIEQLGQDIALAYFGLLEHLAINESNFEETENSIPEVTRTAVVWRFTGLFEALANTDQGPKRAIDQLLKNNAQTLPEGVLRNSGKWPEALVAVRNAFSHISQTLKANYEVPTVEWILQLLERGTALTASVLSQYFESEIPDETARGWLDRAIDETNY